MKSLPFDQQPKESAPSFAAFNVYLSMGDGRTLKAVARKVGKSLIAIKILSSRYRWEVRLKAYVAHLAAVEREATEALVRAKAPGWLKRREDNREEEWELHRELIIAGRKALKRLNNPEREPTLSDVVRAFDLASKLGRLSTGMATDKTEITGEGGGPILVDLEAAIRKVYGPKEAVVVEVESIADTSPLPSPQSGEGKSQSGKQKAEITEGGAT